MRQRRTRFAGSQPLSSAAQGRRRLDCDLSQGKQLTYFHFFTVKKVLHRRIDLGTEVSIYALTVRPALFHGLASCERSTQSVEVTGSSLMCKTILDPFRPLQSGTFWSAIDNDLLHPMPRPPTLPSLIISHRWQVGLHLAYLTRERYPNQVISVAEDPVCIRLVRSPADM
jgi:hypothetical protein